MLFPAHSHLGSSFTIAWLCIGLIGCSGTDSNFNLRGNVTLDSEIIQGVTIRVEDDSGNESDTTTDVRGAYGFEVTAGDKTVSIVMGIPADAQCSPGVEQDVTVPVDGAVEADFACETFNGGGGAGGAGGMGGMGGMGGGGAGGGEGSDPFTQCVERAPGDTACACSPLVPNCSGNTKCSTNFIYDLNDGTVLRFPALDGSEESPATECIFAELKTVGVGDSCNIFSVGDQRRDDCDENLHCEQFSQDDLRCVALCTFLFYPCSSGVCTAFGLTNPGYDEFGRCL